jgi:hypothetical protein
MIFRLCPSCGHTMKLVAREGPKASSDGYVWRCSRREGGKHDREVSIRHGSWFSQSNMTLEEILKVTFWWCLDLNLVSC